MIKPLKLQAATNATAASINANLLATIHRGYKLLEPESCQGGVSIVGAGPSLAWTYKDIAGDVIACNSAHDFLITQGVIPKFAMVWDANPVIADLIKPHHGVTYLVASRCHPKVFEKLEGHDVRVWHAIGDDGMSELMMQHGRNEIAIAGGSSSVLRAIYVAMALGYRGRLHLFGIDSSYSGNETHVMGSLVEQQKFTLRVGGRYFSVAPWMAIQAQDFKFFVPMLKQSGVNLVVHGDGLIPYVASVLGCETPNIRVSWLEKHVRRPLNELQLLYDVLRNSPTTLEIQHAGI